jgi:hypothetical protein
MRTPTLSFLAAAGLVLAACASVAVSTDYDPTFNFGPYRSFAWLQEQQPLTGDLRLDNPLLHQRLREAVERTLIARGYEKAAGAADFVVGYHLSLTQRYDVSTLQSHYGYGPGWNRVGYGPTDTVVTEYEEGTLVIDVVDRRADRLVWRGQAYGRVRESPTPEEREQRVNRVVESILADFPPGMP